MRGYDQHYTREEARRFLRLGRELKHDFGDVPRGTHWEAVGIERVSRNKQEYGVLVRWDGQEFRVSNCLDRCRDRVDPLVDLVLRREFEAILNGTARIGGRPRGGTRRHDKELRACRRCGCTEDHACTGADGLPCFWVERDLCSACAGKP